MAIINGVNSDEFDRGDVIRMFKVARYFGGILLQYPVVNQVNLGYDAGTGTITANRLRSAAGAELGLANGDATLTAAAGRTLIIQAGNALIAVWPEGISISYGGAEITLANGGVQFLGGSDDAASILFQAPNNGSVTGGRPIQFATDSGDVMKVVEEVFGVQKFAAFGVPEVARPIITGSRTGNTALTVALLNALAALGWVDNQTTA